MNPVNKIALAEIVRIYLLFTITASAIIIKKINKEIVAVANIKRAHKLSLTCFHDDCFFVSF